MTTAGVVTRPIRLLVAGSLFVAAAAVLLVSLGFEMFPIVPYLMQPFDITGVGLMLGYLLLAAALVAFAVWSTWFPIRIALVVTALGWASLLYWFQLAQPDGSAFNFAAIVLIVAGSLASGALVAVRRILPRSAAVVFAVTMVAAIVDVFWERYPLWLQNVADGVHFGLLMATGILLLSLRPKRARASGVAFPVVGALFILEGLAIAGLQLGTQLDDAATRAFESNRASIHDTVVWIPLEVATLFLSSALLAVAFAVLAARPVGVIARIAFIIVALHATLGVIVLATGLRQDFGPLITPAISVLYVVGCLVAGVVVLARKLFRRVPAILFVGVMVALAVDPGLSLVGSTANPGAAEVVRSILQAILFALCGIALLSGHRGRTTARTEPE